MNNRPTMLDDWMQPNPSPRTLIASFLSDDFTPRALQDPLTQTQPLNAMEKNKGEGPTSSEEEAQSKEINFPHEFSLQPHLHAGPRPSSSNGGLAERMAARAGFNVPKLNTSRVNPVANVVGSSTDVRSPYLTIPPGLSPTTLLDSPVFLSNILVQPSPTTGKLPFLQSKNMSADQFVDLSESFSFKPSLDLKQSSSSISEKKEPSISLPVQLENKNTTTTNATQDGTTPSNQEFNFNTGFSNSKPTQVGPASSADNADNSPTPDDPQEFESDLKGDNLGGTPAEDGYNWRKYGQKQVKTSEFPRSYYKCTHLNCPVKKKVERAHDGQVTEIIYKGNHNHQKPSPSRRLGMPFSDGSENSQFQPSQNPNQSFWGNGQNGSLQDVQGERVQEVNQTSSLSVPAAPEFSEMANQVMPGGNGACAEGQDVGLVDISSTVSNEEDQATHGASVDYEADEDDGQETDSKRRKLEACAVEINAASRAVREPRVVVQTTSEVDILDDGYRWRKYGQKVVKGNPNPRSYYKCTSPGCSVRKHVERASHDLKSVITTYEGRHNHEVPATRNSGGHSNTATAPPVAALPPQSSTFSRRSDLGTDSLGRFNPTSLPLGPYGLPSRDQLSHLSQLGPAGSFSFRMNQPGLTGFRMPNLGPVPPLPQKMTGMPVLPPNMGPAYLGHSAQGMDGRFVMPKGELKEENMTDGGFRASNGGSTSSLVYQQMMNRMHMGPHM
ncbi:WRKY family transcription factor family protein [Rhynchospora pubera]|uniref:WRKY family transcription factor family protein n=1 Tax=Rhynchospora pubera TaxID=906938 RepID=A0AAV8G7Y7_9POAL|nr:WRKY family transcription factor family protein [Rhynchospora pubera]